ncbi:hypothetical protein E1287_24680 [Actinomadura sp. KC06]|uniref:hypothetical protein n=1 Tax=Actinomadura sp. KC06 TaxID=2530369 RepID=UPI00104DB945|nr:hypothetical protein [Actinomadura sp. KC06]TDD31908.1 hypothetical protein E1287_24680 [Actinomadura sp. KC06]
MQRLWKLLTSYVDVAVAFVLAVAILGLDIAGAASSKVVQSATMATLAVVSLVLLRDRARSDTRGDEVQQSIKALQKQMDVRVISGHECNRVLTEARRETDRWVFRGATGAYIRAVTLPECVSRAKPRRRRLEFRLEILDPMNPDLCHQFVRLHQRLATGPDSPEQSWTVEETRRELFATILAACWHQHHYELLDIDVRLSSAYSLLRYELSSSCLIFTQRGPEFPALVINSGTPSYLVWDSELHVSFQQAKRLPLQSVKGMQLSGVPSPDEIRDLFQALGIELPAGYTDDDLVQVRELALNSADPYA